MTAGVPTWKRQLFVQPELEWDIHEHPYSPAPCFGRGESERWDYRANGLREKVMARLSEDNRRWLHSTERVDDESNDDSPRHARCAKLIRVARARWRYQRSSAVYRGQSRGRAIERAGRIYTDALLAPDEADL